MSLLGLPPELLLRTLSFVGAAYFQEDGGRLAVCQQWFSCAGVVFYQDLNLNPVTLRRLLQHPRALDRVRIDTASVSLTINRESESLGSDVNDLGATLQNSSKATSLRMIGRDVSNPAAVNIRPLLATHLTDLDIDTCGIDLDSHVCPSIGKLLPALHYLRLRMRRICPDVLTTAGNEKLPLNEAIVNLSLNDSHSKHCITGSVLEVRQQILERAEDLSARSSPKVLRILWHSLPDFKLHSKDILSGRLEMLPDDAAWDDVGEEVVSDEPESESDIPSLDSSEE